MRNEMRNPLVTPCIRRLNNINRHRRSRGFMLIEVLIAMLVLAIGLLGIAAMQVRGLQYSHDAYLRSQISVLAASMADRMRLNRALVAGYTAGSPYTVPSTQPMGCTESSVGATNDLACWHKEVFNALPPGSSADIVAELDGEFTIALGWLDREGTAERLIEYTFLP
jgi:type IV pilus assembly protein PilV